MSPASAILWLWGAWFASWLIAASWSDRAAAKATFGSEIVYRSVTVAGMLLLFIADRPFGRGLRLWEAPPAVGWCLVAVAFTGFAFCWWARIHLGRMWSSSVTRKADHHIVDTGPYALVRHPIYTGIIIAAAATAGLEATPIAFAGMVLVIFGFWIKARLEERFLRDELGAEAYDAYARRTGMLLPGL
ncbi:MAG: methyltransferase family protein [Xanthobacteraceae bacterium]